jgi:hypothetical protein
MSGLLQCESIGFHECLPLVLKGNHSVMVFLTRNIHLHFGFDAFADRKRTISPLPTEASVCCTAGFNPNGAGPFGFLQKLGNCLVRMYAHQDVNVIIDTVNSEGHGTLLAEDATDVTV